MKLHHLLHEYFMKPQLRSFQLAEPGAGAGPWPLVPRAGGDRAGVCPGQCLVPSPLLDVTGPPPQPLSTPGSRGQRVPGSVAGARGAKGWDGGCRVPGQRVAARRNGVCHANRLLCFPRCSSLSSPSAPACSPEHSFPSAASLADATPNLSALPALR